MSFTAIKCSTSSGSWFTLSSRLCVHHQFAADLSISSAVIYLTSGAPINVKNDTGGFLYHSNRDIWSIYGGWSNSFMPASGIEVTPAYLQEKLSKSANASRTQAGRSCRTVACTSTRHQHNEFSSNSISPNKGGPAASVHEWTDKWSGIVSLWSLHHTIGNAKWTT